MKSGRSASSLSTLKHEGLDLDTNGTSGGYGSSNSSREGTFAYAMSQAWNNSSGRSSPKSSYPLQTTCLFCPSLVMLSEDGDQDRMRRLMENLCHHMQLSSTELPEGCTNPKFPFCPNCERLITELWKQQAILEKAWMKIGNVVNEIERTVADGEIMRVGKVRAGSSVMAQVEQQKCMRLRDLILEGYRTKLYKRQQRQNSLAENSFQCDSEIGIPPPPQDFLRNMSEEDIRSWNRGESVPLVSSVVTLKRELMEPVQSLNVPFHPKALHLHGRRGNAVHSSLEFNGEHQQQSETRMAGQNEYNMLFGDLDSPELAHYNEGNCSTRVSSIQNGDREAEADRDNEEPGNSRARQIKHEAAHDLDEDYETMDEDDDSNDIFELAQRKRRVIYEGVEMMRANGTGARRHVEYLQCGLCDFTVRLPKMSTKASTTPEYMKLKTHILHVHIKKPGLPEPHRGPILECVLCAIKFANLKELREHKKTHPLEEPLECPICGRPFLAKNQNNLLVHMFTHKNKEERVAAIAAKERGAYASREHKKKEEVSLSTKRVKKAKPVRVRSGRIGKKGKINGGGAVKQKFCCQVCNRVFKKNCGLMSHARVHLNELPQDCGNSESSMNLPGPRRSKRQELRNLAFIQTEVSNPSVRNKTDGQRRYIAEVDDGTRVIIKKETLNILFNNIFD